MARIWTSVPRLASLLWQRPEQVPKRLPKGTENAALLAQRDILVRVASFMFRFVDIGHLREGLAYFQEIHPSSRVFRQKTCSGY